MKFGISMFPTDRSAGPGAVALEAEARGFHAYWVSEHSHMPVNTDFPLSAEVPREYSSMLDPFVALGAAAAVTERIMLGTAIVILPQHDPINCAKAVATVDQISNGRMLFGIGAGWNVPELENHRIDPKTGSSSCVSESKPCASCGRKTLPNITVTSSTSRRVGNGQNQYRNHIHQSL
ncbi:MAG: LLM class flavin-dependent oxidoreductase [Pseudomonadales bacterium]|nr:LLM class flavin-dependent oxidoreductase [Pseudomonadales bacterium]